MPPPPQAEAVKQNLEAAQAIADVAQRPASCIGVLGSKPVPDGTAQLEVTVDGKPFPVALDPVAQYEKNPVWDAGKAPASCGGIQQPAGADPSMVWVVQLHRDGTPVLRLQFLGARGGETKLGTGSRTTGMLRLEGEPRAAALAFADGTLRVSPDPVAAGKVEITIDGSGKALGATAVPFTMKGTLSGTFPPPRKPVGQ
jgi:hypothetical protein